MTTDKQHQQLVFYRPAAHWLFFRLASNLQLGRQTAVLKTELLGTHRLYNQWRQKSGGVEGSRLMRSPTRWGRPPCQTREGRVCFSSRIQSAELVGSHQNQSHRVILPRFFDLNPIVYWIHFLLVSRGALWPAWLPSWDRWMSIIMVIWSTLLARLEVTWWWVHRNMSALFYKIFQSTFDHDNTKPHLLFLKMGRLGIVSIAQHITLPLILL